MSANNNAVNAGVGALLGFEFQRNCALYLLLSDFDSFKDKEFFLCIEHHDDFLFCYRTSCQSQIAEIHSYQAKKRSGSIWTINEKFSEVIAKMLEVGSGLINDPAPKCRSYSHKLTFVSNTDIKLDYEPNKKEKEAGKTGVTCLVNEQLYQCDYDLFPEDIKNKIQAKVDNFCNKKNIIYHKEELDNLRMEWVDFPRQKQQQKNALIGLMVSKFPHVSDPSAAVDLLLNLFRNIEAIYNQGKLIKLLDVTKRVEGHVIKKAIDVIETEQKTFQLWRDYSTELSRNFRIPIGVQSNYKHHIKNAFELLKDMSNNEHQIIKNFVKEHNYSMKYFSHEEMFDAYVSDIKSENSMNLHDIDIFFATLCSFVEQNEENPQ